MQVINWTIALIAFTAWIVSAFYMYDIGADHSRARTTYLQYEVKKLHRKIDELTKQRNLCIVACSGLRRSWRIDH